MNQPIWRPIHRHFCPSCIHWEYFPHNSTEFHYMRTEFQRINDYCSFFTVIIISHKFPAFTWLLAPRSLLDLYPISPQSLPGLLKLCCWTSSLSQRLQTWTLLQRYPLLLLFPLQWMNLQKYFPLKIYQANIAAPTHQNLCLPFGVQRDILVHMPPQKSKTVQTRNFNWV